MNAPHLPFGLWIIRWIILSAFECNTASSESNKHFAWGVISKTFSVVFELKFDDWSQTSQYWVRHCVDRLVTCKMRHRYLTHHKFHFGHPLCHSYAFVASRRPNREKIETSDLHFYFTLTFWLKLNAFELDVAWRKDSKGVQFQLIPLSVHFVVSFGQHSPTVELQIFPFFLCLFLLAWRKGKKTRRVNVLSRRCIIEIMMYETASRLHRRSVKIYKSQSSSWMRTTFSAYNYHYKSTNWTITLLGKCAQQRPDQAGRLVPHVPYTRMQHAITTE